FSNSITAYGASANGNAAPVVFIHGHKTQINNPYGVAIDAAGYLYVGNGPQQTPHVGSIVVFAPGSNGDVKPVQRIVGSNVPFAGIYGLTVR
ncbi:MAG: hypothetical protein JO092_09000, partial [Candidatus Eremiobacteraeota bacterium]|nr:hypothetical protein [Candidatus Eremiobacteraeota bacterium]